MGRREKDLKRRKRKEKEEEARAAEPAPAAPPTAAPPQAMSKEMFEQEFNNPERVTLHLRRLSELLTIVPELRAVRFPQDQLQEKLFAVDRAPIDSAPPEKKPQALRRAVLGALATENLARTARSALQHTLGQARDTGDRLALMAGTMMIDSWLRSKHPAEQNPIWDALFGLSVLDLLIEGVALARIAREALSPDEGNAAKAFAKALSKETGAELEKLGLEERDPQQLAKRYAELVRDRKRSYLLGFDSLLHLVLGNADFAAKNVQRILAEGISSDVRKSALEVFESAYAEDVTRPLAEDLASEIARRLDQLGKEIRGEVEAAPRAKEAEPREQERASSFIALLAFRTLPPEKNAFLRATYLGSYELYRRAAPIEELPFVQKIWQDPHDRWALEEYEKFLLTRRHTHRAARVRRYREEVRSAARASGEAAAGASPPG